jgi:hypothetical protein
MLWKLTVCVKLKNRERNQTHKQRTQEFTWFGNMPALTGDNKEKTSLRK